MIPFKYSDGGRLAEKFFGEKNDCVVRALAIGANLSYKDSYELCSYHGRKKGKGTFNTRGLFQSLGFESITDSLAPIGAYRSEYFNIGSVNQICKRLPQKGSFLIFVRNHVFAFVNGTIFDTFETGKLRKQVSSVWRVK